MLEEKERRLCQIAQKWARVKPTPFLIIDKRIIREKFEQLCHALGDIKVFYAVKANPHRRIVEFLRQFQAGFEISSETELNLLLHLDVPPEKIISSNPVKSPAFIKAAYAAGINHFVVDSFAELEKLAKLAPGSKVGIRLSVSNQGSQWPLSGKFGVEIEEGISLLMQAREQGLEPHGIAFHVGSQCTDPESWVQAIARSKILWEMAQAKGMELKRLNLGGGFPIRYTEPVPPIAAIGSVVREATRRNFPPETEIVVEPGRYLVGEAGVLVATVIAKARREGQNWLYLDVGVFNGLMESVGNIKYPLVAAKEAPLSKWIIAGPSCDSFDVISSDTELPDVGIGEKIYILSAGAYTTVYASQFNGFPIPRVYFL